MLALPSPPSQTPDVPPDPLAPAEGRNVMANVEPGARAATSRSVAAFASLVRYMLTPVETTTAGLLSSKPAITSLSRQASPAYKSTGTKRSQAPSPCRLCRYLGAPRRLSAMHTVELPDTRHRPRAMSCRCHATPWPS